MAEEGLNDIAKKSEARMLHQAVQQSLELDHLDSLCIWMGLNDRPAGFVPAQ